MAEDNQYNIRIESGTDFVLPFIWRDINGEPYDLTGAEIRAQLREFAEAADAFDFVCTHNGAGGRITMSMPKEETALIAFSSGVYDVLVTLSDGTTGHPIFGNAEIRDHVTKPYNGTLLHMIGVDRYEDLPASGMKDRLYFCYENRRIYRWNGLNYIATSIGNGIQRVDFVEHVDDFNDRFRITYDDGTHYDYIVRAKGIKTVALIGSSGDYLTGTTDTYRMTFNTGDHYDYSVHGGRVVFPLFDIDWDTGMLYVTDSFANVTFALDEETGMFYYTY